MAVFSRVIVFCLVFVFIVVVFIQGFAEDVTNSVAESIPSTPVSNADDEYKLSGIADLGEMLKSGKPTLAYFFQSVACSCVTAQCALAGAMIDSLTESKDSINNFHFIKVDVFYTDTADSLYGVDIVPAFIYYNDKGGEVNRLEWDVSADLLKQLINYPEKKLAP